MFLKRDIKNRGWGRILERSQCTPSTSSQVCYEPLCVWVPADVVLLARFPSNHRMRRIKNFFCKITLLASSREQNVQPWTCSTRFGIFPVAFIVGLTLSNLKSECNHFSKIVVSSSDRCDFDFVTNIDFGRESLTGLSRILPTLSRFIPVYVDTKTSFLLLINKW